MAYAWLYLRSALAFSVLSGVSAQAQRPSGDAASAFLTAAPERRLQYENSTLRMNGLSDRLGGLGGKFGLGRTWCQESVRASTGTVGCFLTAFMGSVDNFFGPKLKSIWALPVGLVLMLQWHFCQSAILRDIGKGMVIVNIYYCTFWGATDKEANYDAFIWSCLAIFIDEIVLYRLFHRLFLCYRHRHKMGKKYSFTRLMLELDGEELEGKSIPFLGPGSDAIQSTPSAAEIHARQLYKEMKGQLNKAKANLAFNVYMDFRKPLRRATVVFMVQMGLFMFYVFELNGGNDEEDSPGITSKDPGNFSALKWFLAVTLVVITSEDDIGREYNRHFWRTQIDKLTMVKDESGNPKRNWLAGWRNASGKRAGLPPSVHLLLRCYYDLWINGITWSVIRGTVPIMLAVEGPLDFVKDATSIFFLLKLDDLGDDKDLGDPGTWDFSNDDVGYTFDEFNDPFYDYDKINAPLNFPSRKEIIELARQNLEKQAKGDESRNAAPKSTAKVETVASPDYVSPTYISPAAAPNQIAPVMVVPGNQLSPAPGGALVRPNIVAPHLAAPRPVEY